MADRSLHAYIAAVASSAPTPGGGSVVAVAAALGAALGEMVITLTRGNSAPAEDQTVLANARDRLTTLRGRLLAAAPADEAAYRGYLAAVALPRGTDDERAIRRAAIQRALAVAADEPLDVATACVELSDTLVSVATFGNKHALADAEIGALLAETALRGALINVRGNAAMLRDTAAADDYRHRADALETAGRAATARVLTAAAGRRS